MANNHLEMAASGGCRIIVIVAPAGFGKTRILRDFASSQRASGDSVAWLDGEAATLSRDGAAALATVRELAASAQTLIIDGADRLVAQVRDMLCALFLDASPSGRLVISLRNHDGLHLARWQASGHATIVNGTALLLRRSDLARLWKGRLTADQMRRMERVTEGWPAPSWLLGEYLLAGGQIDDDGVYLETSLIASYVAEEVLGALPAEWLPTLAAISTAPGFDAELLRILAPDPALSIDTLVRHLGPLLVVAGQGMFRFNALLNQCLRGLFHRALPKSNGTALEQVADWAAARGDILTAARLVVQGPSPSRLAEYVRAAGDLRLWMLLGDLHDLVGIAGPLTETAPALMLLRCIVLLKDGEAGQANALFERAMAIMPDTADAQRDATIVHAVLHIYGCRTLLAADDAILVRIVALNNDPMLRMLLPTMLAMRHSQKAEFDHAVAYFLEARGQAQRTHSSYHRMFLSVHDATIAIARGSLPEAGSSLADARRLWRMHFRDDHGAETVVAALSTQHAFESGRFADARRHLRLSGHRLPGSEAWLDVYVAAYEPMMRLLVIDHGIGTAVATIEGLCSRLRAQSLDRIAVLLESLSICLTGEAWLLGAFEQAQLAAVAADALVIDPQASWQEREFLLLARTYVSLARDDFADARDAAGELIDYARDRGLKRSLVRGLLVRAAVLDRTGEANTADRDFRDALEVGNATGLRAAFQLFGGPATARRLAVVQENPPARLADFLAGFPQTVPRTHLTPREREILLELAIGGSDKAIGRRLGISEHAVRFHLKGLFRKLGVRDRAAAAARQDALHDGLGTKTS
ncbi:LuxR C-terminal-related transcriptional regulator [Sphingosinicellaceae bacterium]|nr:LuxR C-terminal-related transcriptional regulator [Sphingosinicellaceae bacterium]